MPATPKYSVELAAGALRALRKLKSNQIVLKSIRATLKSLETDPRPNGVEKLTGSESLRVRDGSFRIVYDVDDEKRVVIVHSIADRKDVYRH